MFFSSTACRYCSQNLMTFRLTELSSTSVLGMKILVHAVSATSSRGARRRAHRRVRGGAGRAFALGGKHPDRVRAFLEPDGTSMAGPRRGQHLGIGGASPPTVATAAHGQLKPRESTRA